MPSPDQETPEVQGDARSHGAARRLSFLISAVLLGGLLSMLDVPPFPSLARGMAATRTLVMELRQTRPAILEPISHKGTGLVAIDRKAAQPGYTLIQGLMPGGAQIRMLDLDGKEVHRWKIDFFDIWPDPKHIVPASRIPKSDFGYHTQGFWPLQDGSVVVNVGDLGTARLDRCGKVVWKLDRMTHHSITRTEDGKFWIPAHIPVAQTSRNLLPPGYSADQIDQGLVGHPKNYHNSVLLVDRTGKVEKEFSVLQAINDAGLEHALHDSFQSSPLDPTHANDIEVVTEQLAALIEEAEAGDLLVSIREMNMLAILDQNDGRLKWYRQGTWVRQHDPDIMPDGTIEIFNNRSKSSGYHVSGSQIVSYDPRSDTTRVLLPKGPKDNFFSSILGAHQRLDNGNLLITESTAGRAFEETPDGRIVWDYRLPYDGETASLFELAMRVPDEYFTLNDWTCEE